MNKEYDSKTFHKNVPQKPSTKTFHRSARLENRSSWSRLNQQSPVRQQSPDAAIDSRAHSKYLWIIIQQPVIVRHERFGIQHTAVFSARRTGDPDYRVLEGLPASLQMVPQSGIYFP